MPISLSALQEAAGRSYRTSRANSIFEAKANNQQTAFLSHSGSDKILAAGLQALLRENGWNLYLYWQDAEMPEPPTRNNAQNVQSKIREADWFLFLASPNSMKSKWCPWEIGYADGVKTLERIMVIPTVDNLGYTHGTEYLQLYRQITYNQQGGLLSIPPNAALGTPLGSVNTALWG